MSFIKYNSLTNHYQQKDIDYLITANFDKLQLVDWVVGEKIDGSNISFLFQPKIDPLWFSRNQEITGSNFQGGKEVIEETIGKMYKLQAWVNNSGRSIRVFGELFGPGIQNRIYYGNKKRILFFDLMIDDKFVSQEQFENFFYDLNIGYLTIPKFAIFSTFEEAMEYDLEFNSQFSDKEDNIAEGVVIKPYKQPLFTANGSIFYIKKKHPKHSEKEQKEKKPRKEYSEEINNLQHKFSEMVNENRVKSIFSKEEEISSHKQIGTYLGFVKKDIMEEFVAGGFNKKDFDINEYKFITCSTDKDIVRLLKMFL